MQKPEITTGQYCTGLMGIWIRFSLSSAMSYQLLFYFLNLEGSLGINLTVLEVLTKMSIGLNAASVPSFPLYDEACFPSSLTLQLFFSLLKGSWSYYHFMEMELLAVCLHQKQKKKSSIVKPPKYHQIHLLISVCLWVYATYIFMSHLWI